MNLDALFETHGEVDELEFGIEFHEHMAQRATYDKHLVSVSEILDVHSGVPKYFENTVEDGAPIIMVGATKAARWICVPIDPTSAKGVWSPRTAFQANAHHKKRYAEG